MSTDNSKYGISKEDIERAAFGDFDDYEPPQQAQPVQPVINVQPVQDNTPVDIYSNGQADYGNNSGDMIFCTNCGAQLPADSLFCTSCGASVGAGYDNGQQYDQQYNDAQYGAAPVANAPVFCTVCGNQITDGYQFCTNCGTPVSAGYNDAQQYRQPYDDGQQYVQQYDNNGGYDDDSPTLAADAIMNGQYAQYAANDAYDPYGAQQNQYAASDAYDPYAAQQNQYAANDAFDPYGAQQAQYAADSLVFCSGCGAQISSSLKFCTSCGTPVAPDMGYADPYANNPYAQPAPPAKKGGFFSKRKKK